MSTKLLKKIAGGGEFDLVAAIREVATVLTKGPLEVDGSITAASFVPREGGQAGQTGGAKKGKRNVPAITADSGVQP